MHVSVRRRIGGSVPRICRSLAASSHHPIDMYFPHLQISARLQPLPGQVSTPRYDNPVATGDIWRSYCHARAARQLFIAYAAYRHHLPSTADTSSVTTLRPTGTRGESIMNSISKTLNEMTLVERSNLLDTVADALEATAEQAEDAGDVLFATNSTCVANTIRGISGSLGIGDLSTAELLLEQGIMLVHQYSNRSSPETRH